MNRLMGGLTQIARAQWQDDQRQFALTIWPFLAILIDLQCAKAVQHDHDLLKLSALITLVSPSQRALMAMVRHTYEYVARNRRSHVQWTKKKHILKDRRRVCFA